MNVRCTSPALVLGYVCWLGIKVDLSLLRTEAEVLEEIATDLSLTDLDDMKGNLKRLYRKIANHINSDDFDVLEDQGLGPLMSMRDKLRVALNLSAGDPDDISPGDDKGNDKVKKEESGSDSDDSDSKSDTSDNDDEFKDALSDLLNPGKKKPIVQTVGVTGTGGVNPGSLTKLTPQAPVGLLLLDLTLSSSTSSSASSSRRRDQLQPRFHYYP